MTKWTEEELKKKLSENPDLQIVELRGDDLVEEVRRNSTGDFWESPSPVSATPSKYLNRRTEYNGNLYASKKEATTAFVLDLRKAAGEISFWLRQVNFPLLGKMVYRADFVTFTWTGYTVGGITWLVKVIEVKGYQTEAWKMKRKLFAETYPNLELEVI